MCILLGEVKVHLQLLAVDIAALECSKGSPGSQGAVKCHHDLPL